MSEQTILHCCAFGIPLVLIAVGIAVVGFILRRVRPDLYMTDEEKEQAERRLERELAEAESDVYNNNDNNKEHK